MGHGQTRDEDDAAAIKKKGEEDGPPRDPPRVTGSSATTRPINHMDITPTICAGTARHSHPHIIHISSMNVTDIQLLSVPHAGPLTRTHNSVTSPKPQLAAH